MTNNELNSKADFNPAKHQNDAGFRNPEPTHDADKSDVVFLSMAQAAKMTGYHQDYLGQMARSGKLEAIKVGRNWQTTKLAIDKMLGRVPKEEPAPIQKVEAPKVSAPVEVAKTEVAVPTPAPVVPVIAETPKPVVSEPVKIVAAVTPPPVPPAPPKVTVAKIIPPPVPRPIVPVVTHKPVEKVSEPVKVTSQISAPTPAPAIPVSKPVAVNIPKPQAVAVNVPRPEPLAEKIAPKISISQPVKISAPVTTPIVEKQEVMVAKKNFAKKVHIKHYPVSKEAGPNLQEMIAGYSHEDLVQYTDIEVDNREKLLRWNKIAPEYNTKKQSFTPNRVKEFANHYPEKSEPVVEKRSRPVWTYATVGVTTLVLLTAGYFASTFMSPSPESNLNAFIAPQRMVAGEATSVKDPITGKAIIPVGVTEFVVKDEGVNSDSTILITLRENFGGRYWVAGQREGEFVIKLSEPVKVKTPFDYMILAEEDGGAE